MKTRPVAWEPVSAGEYAQAMGQHAASVCVITTAIGNERYGLTATAVCSVSAQPPRLLVCVNRSSFTHAKIVEAGAFCVNVLSETQDIVAKAFAGMLGASVDRFGVAQWTSLRTGAPALVGAAAVFDCVVGESLEQFTHTVFFGDVVGVSHRIGQETLLYGSRKFRQLRGLLLSIESAPGETLHF
jgi:flavin reductase (DIM6/NTAB) family NADH-FMN oxidoreductase RutF